MSDRHKVYGLRPDRRFLGRFDAEIDAEGYAFAVVNAKHYPGAEVWDSTLRDGEGAPIYGVFRAPTGRIEEHRSGT